MGDMTGRTVLVTGATSGIGRETAAQLASMGARVLVHGRTADSVDRAARELEDASHGGLLEPISADLTSLAAVRDLADEVGRRAEHLDVLVNNAGTYVVSHALTPDGNETTFAVNHLAAFALTLLLGGLLEESAPSRVITVSSVAHFRGTIPLEDPTYSSGYDAIEAYADSKLANVLFALEAAGRFAGTGVTSNTLHPGIIDTKLLRAGFPDRSGASPAVGASTPVYLATSPEVEDVSGRYFVNRHPAQPAPAALDHELRERLWAVSQDITHAVMR